MTFDGSGTYTRSNGTFTGSTIWANDRDAGTKIVASNHDTHDQDIAAALTSCVTKTGVSTPTANMPFGGFRLTNVGSGTARTDAINVGQVQDGAVIWGGTTGGTTTAYTATLTPAITAYVTGMVVRVKLNATCGASPTINFNSVGAANLRNETGAIAANQLRVDRIYDMIYQSASPAGFYIREFSVPIWTTWSPTIAPSSGTLSSSTVNYAKYLLTMGTVYFSINVSATVSSGTPDYITFTLPVTAAANSQIAFASSGKAGAVDIASYGFQASTTLGAVGHSDGFAGSVVFGCQGFYEI